MERAAKFIWVLLMLATSPRRAADVSPEQVRAILAAAAPDKPADLSGKSLENLDLSNFDLKEQISRGPIYLARKWSVRICRAPI